MIDEIKEQLHGNIPDAIVVAVGGGGLLCGVCQGLHQVGWGHVPVVAMETVGCDSLNYCIREKQWTELSDITRLPCVYTVCMYIECVCVCVCLCVHVYLCVCLCVHVYLCVCLCSCLCVRARASVRTSECFLIWLYQYQ